MKIFIVFLSVFLFAPSISIATPPVTQKEGTDNVEAVNLKKKYQYFLKTSFENDNWSVIKDGNDEGYTHGHLSHITKSCDSGVDINIAVDSRLFTDVIGFYKTPEGDLRFQSRFEEENRLTVEHTNWRSFDELYQRAGLTIGHLSQERFHLAGREQKLFHDSLSSITGTDASDFEDQRAEHSEYIQTSDLQILKYEYLPEDKEKTFIGAHIAFGKSYSLNNLKGTCASPCVNYFRTEAGVEMISLKHGSNVYILSEIDKAIHHPWDALSVFASLKAQKNEHTNSIYSEGSLGVKFRISQFQLHYLITKRFLSDNWNQFREYDRDEDYLVFVGIQIPLL